MTGSVNVTVSPSPLPFNVTGGGSYCAGGTGIAVGLSGSQTDVNYQLYNGTSPVGAVVPGNGLALNFGLQTVAGTYSVVAATNVVTSAPCTLLMTGTVSVSISPVPTAFTVSGGGAYCSGGTGVAVNLSGSQASVTYTLLLNSTAQPNPVAGTGAAISF
jgi:hypothetical protein